MAQFRASMQGGGTVRSALGTKASGITSLTQSWSGEIYVRAWDNEGIDWFTVTLRQHGTHADGVTLYNGPANGWANHQGD